MTGVVVWICLHLVHIIVVSAVLLALGLSLMLFIGEAGKANHHLDDRWH